MSDSPRGDRILLLAARYGLLTHAGIAASLFASEKAAERLITRLLSADRLRSQPLVGRKVYYTLTPQSAKDLGLDANRFVLPMGVQALASNFAMMAFCLLGEPRHERLLRGEFIAKFEGLAKPGVLTAAHRTRYYLDFIDKAQGHVRLALLVPDLGQHPRRLARKVRREIEKRRQIPQLKDLIRDRLFSVTVLTGFPEKARQLTANLAKEPFHFRAAIVPDLAELLLFTRQPSHDQKLSALN